MGWVLFWGVIFLLSGAFFCWKPYFWWTLTQSWKTSAGSEPSDGYLTYTRVGAGLLTAAGAAFMVLGVLFW